MDGEMPLALVQASPVSEMLRYTSVLPYRRLWHHLSPKMCGTRPRWRRYSNLKGRRGGLTDDLKVIQKMKLALFEDITMRLMASIKGLNTTVVVGDARTTRR